MAKKAVKKAAKKKSVRNKQTRIAPRKVNFDESNIDWSSATKTVVQPKNKRFVRFRAMDTELEEQLERIELIDRLPKEGRDALGI